MTLKEKILNFVKDGTIDIPEKNVYEFKHYYPKDIFLETLADVIVENVDFPFKKYTESELVKDFKSLKYKNVYIVNEKFETRGEYKYPISNLYIESNINGNIASNYFQQ